MNTSSLGSIFARFTAFTTVCNDGSAKEDILNQMEFLEDYTRDHFKDEEKTLI